MDVLRGADDLLYVKTWPLTQLSNLLLLVACVALHLHALARSPRREQAFS